MKEFIESASKRELYDQDKLSAMAGSIPQKSLI